MSSIWDMVVGHDEAVAMLKDAVDCGPGHPRLAVHRPPRDRPSSTRRARVFAAALNCPAGGDGT